MEAEGMVLVWEVGNKRHGVSWRRGRGYIGVGGRRLNTREVLSERRERYNEGRERTMGTEIDRESTIT